MLSIGFAEPPVQPYLEAFYSGRLDAASLDGERFEVVRCPDCGLTYQSWVPDDALLAHLYGDAARRDPAELARRRGLAVRLNYAHEIELFLRFFGRAPSEVEVLDFGSGHGDWLCMAAAFGCRTSGAELHPDGLRRIADDGHTAVPSADLPSGRYDFINAEQVVEHVVDPAGIMAALGTALRPGGLLHVSVPNGSDILERLEVNDWNAPKGSAHSLNAIAPLEHINCFDPGSLKRLATDVGLVPFRYPLRTQLHTMSRLRFAASSLSHLVKLPPGTNQIFRKP